MSRVEFFKNFMFLIGPIEIYTDEKENSHLTIRLNDIINNDIFFKP